MIASGVNAENVDDLLINEFSVWAHLQQMPKIAETQRENPSFEDYEEAIPVFFVNIEPDGDTVAVALAFESVFRTTVDVSITVLVCKFVKKKKWTCFFYFVMIYLCL